MRYKNGKLAIIVFGVLTMLTTGCAITITRNCYYCNTDMKNKKSVPQKTVTTFETKTIDTKGK